MRHEQESSVTGTTSSHTGFVYPPQLNPEVQALFTEVESAIQAAEQSNPLAAARDVIVKKVSGNPFQSRAFQLFAHLVFLQQSWVLPGYPCSVSTPDACSTGIREFCLLDDQFSGELSMNMIEDSDMIRIERIYRAKVYSTTAEFARRSQILPDQSRWKWTTERIVGDDSYLTNVIFDEGTAHNAVVARSREWLATHPVVDWVCAPHVMGDPVGTQAGSRFSFGSTDSEPPAGPVKMFDFAGFVEEHSPRLAVVGFVLDDESPAEIQEQIARAAPTDAAVVLVFPTRQAIVDFIAHADSNGWFPHESVPLDDVAEHYNRQPSIPAINEEFSKQALETDKLRFVSRKQLIDEFIDPVSVFPEHVVRRDA
ncbi:hypothetical protein [Halobacteriaceae bacterium SHR40]|uniref:hypothetical protein n=1 Tax=Halovenus amylolytica TaxID=2500550 RepID=UPI000FE2F175